VGYDRPSPQRHRQDDQPGLGTWRFQRAIRRRHVFAAELAVREMDYISVANALALTVLIASGARGPSIAPVTSAALSARGGSISKSQLRPGERRRRYLVRGGGRRRTTQSFSHDQTAMLPVASKLRHYSRFEMFRILTCAVAVGVAVLATASVSWGTSGGLNGKIAFISGPNEKADLYTVNPDGTGLTRLTKDHTADTSPAWSANGRQLAWSHGGALLIYDAAGIRFRRVGESAGYLTTPSWSLDSRFIYAVNTHEDDSGDVIQSIVRIEAGNGKVVDLTPPTRSDYYYKMRDSGRPLVAPDASLYASLDLVDCDELGLPASGSFGICSGMFSLGIDAAAPRPLWTVPQDLLGEQPWYDISPDGNFFATTESTESGHGSGVVLLDRTGGSARTARRPCS
jgi:WD40-like Beta Propeller Repeat